MNNLIQYATNTNNALETSFIFGIYDNPNVLNSFNIETNPEALNTINLSNQIQVDCRRNNILSLIESRKEPTFDSFCRYFAGETNYHFINSNRREGPKGLKYQPGLLSVDGKGVQFPKLDSYTLFNYIDDLLHAVGDVNGENSIIYVNDYLREEILLSPNAVIYKNEWDQTVKSYKKAKIVDISRRVNQHAPIIPNQEDIYGTPPWNVDAYEGGNFTSLYVVKIEGGTFSAYQKAMPSVVKGVVCDLRGKPIMDTYTIEWSHGWEDTGTAAAPSIARLYGIAVPEHITNLEKVLN